MFILLAAVITLHQVYATLFEKVEHWPLRVFILRFIEMLGRTFVGPFILIYFASNVKFADDKTQEGILYTVIAGSVILFLRECGGLRSAFRDSCRLVLQKVNDPTLLAKDLSILEVILINRISFHVWSTSRQRIVKELTTHGSLAVDSKFLKPTFQLRNQVVLDDLLRSNSSGTPSAAASAVASTGVLPNHISPSSHRKVMKQTQGPISNSIELSALSNTTAANSHVSMTNNPITFSSNRSASSEMTSHVGSFSSSVGGSGIGSRANSLNRNVRQVDSDDE
jgi:hypothetical protein